MYICLHPQLCSPKVSTYLPCPCFGSEQHHVPTVDVRSRFWQDTSCQPKEWARDEPWVSVAGAGHSCGGTLRSWPRDDYHRGAHDSWQLAGPDTCRWTGVCRSPGPSPHVRGWPGSPLDDTHCLSCPHPQLTPVSAAVNEGTYWESNCRDVAVLHGCTSQLCTEVTVLLTNVARQFI